MASPRRFARNRDVSPQTAPPLALSPSSSQSNLYASSDPPLRRSRNLPGNPASPQTPSPNLRGYAASPPTGSPSSSTSSSSSRFRRDPAQRNDAHASSASPLRSASGILRSPRIDPQAHAAAQEQMMLQDWNLPRKRGQTPVSEAKFYSQLEKVSGFMRMLLHKERESELMNQVNNNNQYGSYAQYNNYNQNSYNNNYGGSISNNNRYALNSSGGLSASGSQRQMPPQMQQQQMQPQQQKDYPTLDLLMPDFEGTQTIIVRQDILTKAPEEASAGPDLITFSPQVPARGGRFGIVSSQNSPSNTSAVDLSGSYGVGGSGMLYAPLQDNRKLKSNIVDVKYLIFLQRLHYRLIDCK